MGIEGCAGTGREGVIIFHPSSKHPQMACREVPEQAEAPVGSVSEIAVARPREDGKGAGWGGKGKGEGGPGWCRLEREELGLLVYNCLGAWHSLL